MRYRNAGSASKDSGGRPVASALTRLSSMNTELGAHAAWAPPEMAPAGKAGRLAKCHHSATPTHEPTEAAGTGSFQNLSDGNWWCPESVRRHGTQLWTSLGAATTLQGTRGQRAVLGGTVSTQTARPTGQTAQGPHQTNRTGNTGGGGEGPPRITRKPWSQRHGRSCREPWRLWQSCFWTRGRSQGRPACSDHNSISHCLFGVVFHMFLR